MNIKQKLVYTISFIAILVTLLIILIPFVFGSKNNTPTINWQPSKINVETFKGAGRIVDVQFTSSETIDGVELFIVPEIRPYIKILDRSFSSHINADEINSLRLLFSIPNNIPLIFIEGTIHLRQNNKTISKPLPITINILDPTSAVSNLENYLLNQFGTTEPPVGSIISPPQEIIDALSIGSNLPLIFKSGSLNFVGYLPPEDGLLKSSVSNLINLLSEKTLNIPPLINALNNTVYTKDDPQKTVIPYGADAATFYIGPSPRLLSPLRGIDTNGDNKFDTFVLILDSSIHTILRARDIENIKGQLFFEKDLILNQSARTALHELVHATNFNSRCNGLNWLISDSEELYTTYLENLFTDIISSGFAGIDFNYNQASDIISPNLTCLEILNIIPPQAVVLNEPTNITQTSLDLSWSQNYDSDFRFYRIYRSINPNVNFGAILVAEINNQTRISFNDTNLQAGTTYYYKVFVFDKSGLSSESNEVITKTLSLKPSLPTWTLPINISNTSLYSYRPKIHLDSQNNAYAIWIDTNWSGNYKLLMTKYDGNIWSNPAVVISSSAPFYNFDFSIDSQDAIHLTYVIPFKVFYTRYKNNNWSSPEIIASASDSSIDTDSQNFPHIIYGGYPIYDIFYTRYTGVQWTPPLNISNASGEETIYGSRAIKIDRSDNIHVIWSNFSQLFYTKFNGVNWLTPLSISSYLTNIYWISISANYNTIAVAYTQGNNDCVNQEVYSNLSIDNGNTWNEPVKISGSPQIGSWWPFIYVNSSRNVHVMWSECVGGDGVPYKWFNGIQWSDIQDISNSTLTAMQPNLIIAPDNKIYAIWSSNGEIYFSSSYIR